MPMRPQVELSPAAALGDPVSTLSLASALGSLRQMPRGTVATFSF